MNSTSTARLVFPLLLLFILLIFSFPPDYSFFTALSILFLLFRPKSYKIFILSGLVFGFYFIFQVLQMNILYIYDLSVDAYILFVTGVISYLSQRDDVQSYLSRVRVENSKKLDKDILVAAGLSILISLLIYPLIGSFGIVTAYFIFIYFTKKFNGKIALSIALIFLILIMISMLLKINALADELGNYTYFFLIIGTIQELITSSNIKLIFQQKLMNNWRHLKIKN